MQSLKLKRTRKVVFIKAMTDSSNLGVESSKYPSLYLSLQDELTYYHYTRHELTTLSSKVLFPLFIHTFLGKTKGRLFGAQHHFQSHLYVSCCCKILICLSSTLTQLFVIYMFESQSELRRIHEHSLGFLTGSSPWQIPSINLHSKWKFLKALCSHCSLLRNA